jgi:hypothetical protein
MRSSADFNSLPSRQTGISTSLPSWQSLRSSDDPNSFFSPRMSPISGSHTRTNSSSSMGLRVSAYLNHLFNSLRYPLTISSLTGHFTFGAFMGHSYTHLDFYPQVLFVARSPSLLLEDRNSRPRYSRYQPFGFSTFDTRGTETPIRTCDLTRPHLSLHSRFRAIATSHYHAFAARKSRTRFSNSRHTRRRKVETRDLAPSRLRHSRDQMAPTSTSEARDVNSRDLRSLPPVLHSLLWPTRLSSRSGCHTSRLHELSLPTLRHYPHEIPIGDILNNTRP